MKTPRLSDKEHGMKCGSNAHVPKVSAVIPFYSNVGWLCEAVESVLSQDYDNFEVIVVNDGSKDDVSGFLEKYGDRIIYIKQENGGAASARNCGINIAEGDYIAFLDSDDIWCFNKLSAQMQVMLAHKARWSFSDYEFFGDSIDVQQRKVLPDDEIVFERKVPPYIATPTVIAERALLTDNQLGFCVDLKYGEDIVLWEQLVFLAPALYVPQNLVRVRIRGTNAGKRAAVQIRARVDMYDKCVRLIPGYADNKSKTFRFAVKLCRFGRKFVKEDKLDGKLTEFKARVLFVLPYAIFKLDRKLH